MALGLIALFWSVIQNTWTRFFGRKEEVRAAG
jgi:hypothetical protein